MSSPVSPGSLQLAAFTIVRELTKMSLGMPPYVYPIDNMADESWAMVAALEKLAQQTGRADFPIAFEEQEATRSILRIAENLLTHGEQFLPEKQRLLQRWGHLDLDEHRFRVHPRPGRSESQTELLLQFGMSEHKAMRLESAARYLRSIIEVRADELELLAMSREFPGGCEDDLEGDLFVEDVTDAQLNALDELEELNGSIAARDGLPALMRIAAQRHDAERTSAFAHLRAAAEAWVGSLQPSLAEVSHWQRHLALAQKSFEEILDRTTSYSATVAEIETKCLEPDLFAEHSTGLFLDRNHPAMFLPDEDGPKGAITL